MIKHARASSAALTTALVILFCWTEAAATPLVAADCRRGLSATLPNLALTGLTRDVARGMVVVQGRWSRSDFMEDTPKEIAMENRANPWQAWALAFFPTAVVKGVTLGLAFAKAETDQWAVFLPMIPSMGISHFWETKFHWAGLIALAGDIAGSALVTYYWSEVYSTAAGAPKPSQNLLWAGIGVIAVFWIYEQITAPLFANWRNSKLRDQFMPAEKKSALFPSWRANPWPNRGIAQIGPPIRQAAPISAGYAFQF